MGHEAVLRPLNVTRGQQQSTPALDPADPSGFSHLLGTPQPWQCSRWGNDPGATRDVLTRLVRALPEAPDWPCALKPGVSLDDNPFIPSGYTYLMQFVAHDLIQTHKPFPQSAAMGIGSASSRTGGMMLETLYGGGPAGCPATYEPAAGNGNAGSDRTRLRLGAIAGHDSSAAMFRDLPRKTAHDDTKVATHAGARAAAAVDAADPRNDDNPILAQLVALFSLAHNIIADKVQPVRPEARFAYARAVMLAIYHGIIRNDLLPRLLHPAVWRAMNERHAASETWLWQQPGLPLEFSHGAFRAGHAMVRPGYILNSRVGEQDIADLLGGNRHTGDATPAPLQPDRVVQWSRFFTLGATPSYSRRISPSRSSLDFRDLLPATGDDPDAVTFRDLLSAAAARLWSVDAMIAAIMERAPGLIPLGWMFAVPARRRSIIAQWLTRLRTPANGLTDGDLAALADDPPLPLFILLEAGLDPILRGRCLGVLGSIIVGEVLFQRLAMERSRLEMLRTAAHTALPAELAAAVSGIDSMPGLVQFVARFGGMDDGAGLPFI